MFIKNRDQYLIQENIKQAKEYLTKYDIPVNNNLFKHILNKLGKYPNLVDTFTRMIFDEESNKFYNNDPRKGKEEWTDKIFKEYEGSLRTYKLDDFNRVSDWIIDNKQIINQLPKNITQYSKLEELSDDIVQLELNRKVHKFTKSLYRSMREEVGKLEGDQLQKYNDLALSFMKLDEKSKSNFTPLKYFEKNGIELSEFMLAIDKYINSQDVNEEKKRVLKYITENPDKLEVVYNQDNVIAIQSNDKETVCDLGAQSWCIVYSDSLYNNYLNSNNKNTQYIIYNFNLPATNKNSMFGVTLNVLGDVYSRGTSQNRNNGYTELSEIYSLTGIPEGTLVSKYEEDYNKLQELIKGIENISVDELDDKIQQILNLSNKMSLTVNLSEGLVEWLFKNKGSVEENIKYIKILMSNDDFKKRGEKFLVMKYPELVEEIKSDIIKSKESLFNYFINEKELMGQFSVQFTPLSLLYNSDLDLTLTEVVKLSYIHQYHVLDSSYFRIPESIYKKYLNKESLITFKEGIDKLSKELSDINVKIPLLRGEVEVNDWVREINDTYSALVEKFMEDITDMSYEEFKSNYELFEDYLEDGYIIDKTHYIYYKYLTPETASDIDDFIIGGVDEISDLFDKDNYPYNGMPDDEYLKALGEAIIRKGVDPESDDVNDIMLYSMSLSGGIYNQIFKKSIGLKYDDKNKVWFHETDYDTIGDYFKEKFEFEDMEFERWYDDTDRHDDYTTEIDIQNLMTLAHYFKDNGFNINVEPLKKFESKEYLNSYGNININYKKSQEIYREDKEVKSILSLVDDIINERYDYEEVGDGENPYDNIEVDEIQGNIKTAYNSANNDGVASEYHSNQLKEIGNKFLIEWPDSEKSSFNDYYKWGDDGELQIIPDLEEIMGDEFFENIQEYDGSDFTIDSMIDSHIDQIGKLSWTNDDGYIYWEDDHYDMYNERLSENLSMENIQYSVDVIDDDQEEKSVYKPKSRGQLEMEFESRIIKYSDFN